MQIGMSIGLGAALRGPLVPSAVSDLVLWLKANDAATVINTAGAVSQWSDKSGRGNHATQGTGAQQPLTGSRTINSKNAILFDGTDDNLILPPALYTLPNGDNTILAVFQLDTGGDSTQRIYNAQDAGSGRHFIGYANTPGFSGSNTATGAGAPVETWTKDTSINIGLFRRNGTSATANRAGGSGSTNSNGSSFTATQSLIGGQTSSTNRFKGALAELLMFSRALSNAEINGLAAYLTREWGPTWTDI